MRLLGLLAFGLAAQCLGGCSGRPDDIADVAGEVLLDDSPLAGATVHFQSVADPGVIYLARTDEQGNLFADAWTRCDRGARW